MIRTDGRPTIAWAPHIPGQMTVEECIEEAKAEEQKEWPPADPEFGGHN